MNSDTTDNTRSSVIFFWCTVVEGCNYNDPLFYRHFIWGMFSEVTINFGVYIHTQTHTNQ